MPKTGKKQKASPDLMVEILDLQCAIYEKAEERGLAHYLMDRGQLAVIPHHDGRFWSADVELRFQPNHGIEYTLTAAVTGGDRARPLNPGALADQFVQHLEHLRDNAEAVSADRKAIRRATLEVIAEAAQEGIALELMRMEASPVIVCRSPDQLNRHGRYVQVFYVHLLMPHDDAGKLTDDVYTIDADEPEEFAHYLRSRTLPELRRILTRFSEPAAGRQRIGEAACTE